MGLGKRLLMAAAVAGLAAGCTVGEGSGTATGMIWIVGCVEGRDYGTPEMMHDFDMSPTFFAGEPIEGIGDGPPENRINIRMQRDGNAAEINDTIYFDVPNSYEVARCLRGRTVNGVGDWDMSTGTIYAMSTGDWCEPMGAADGGPRIRLRPRGPVAASFEPLYTCQSSAHPPSIVNVTGVALDGWIDFQDFGRAEQVELAPEARSKVEADFKVAYGDRLRASFHIDLADQRVVTTEIIGQVLPPAPRIGGTLDGTFDFDLARGRSAQTFP
jgi:hypothetical protein